MKAIGDTTTCLKNGYPATFCKAKCPIVPADAVTHGDTRDLLRCIPKNSVDLIVTSPPYAERRLNTYGGIPPDEYADWFVPIADALKEVLKPTGSFFLNIKDVIIDGHRHPYVYDLVRQLYDRGWRWVDTYIWHKKTPFPGRRKHRFKDGFEYVYHFAKSNDIQFFPDAVRIPTSPATIKRLSKLSANDRIDYQNATKSGLHIKRANFLKYDSVLPSNVLFLSTEVGNKHHPAAFPEKLPEFFIKAFSSEGDLVLDPFAGSGTTGAVAKRLCRHFIGFDKERDYVSLGNDRMATQTPICQAKTIL